MFIRQRKEKSVSPLSQEEWNVRYDILKHTLWIVVKCLLSLDAFWFVVFVTGTGPNLQIFLHIIVAPAVLTFAAVLFEICFERFYLPLNDHMVLLITNIMVILVLVSDKWTHSLQVVGVLPMLFCLIIGTKRLLYLQILLSGGMMVLQFFSVEHVQLAFPESHRLLSLSGIVFDAVLVAQIIMQIRKYTQMLDTQTTIDSLTRLYNHEAFYEELDARLEDYSQNEKPLSILIADIDNFKQVNDTYGHAYGDKVLKALAAIFSAESSETCFVARYGGEEFAMIMELDQQDAINKAQKIRKNFEQKKIPTDSGIVNSFTISVGVAFYREKYKNSSQFFEKADAALYRAKAGGKNKVCL